MPSIQDPNIFYNGNDPWFTNKTNQIMDQLNHIIAGSLNMIQKQRVTVVMDIHQQNHLINLNRHHKHQSFQTTKLNINLIDPSQPISKWKQLNHQKPQNQY